MALVSRKATGHLSILIVNFNGGKYLEGCFTSIREKVSVPYEVIVVDNNSTDGSAELIAEGFPWVKLIRSPDNLGFAAGNNLAARHATGEYLLLLNNDTLLETDLRDAIDILDEDARVGAVGAGMYSGDGAKRPSCAHFPNPARLWFFASLWHDPTIKGKRWHSPSKVPMYQCDFVEGSFLMTRASAWERLGGIDERNYMYGDDVEYCRSLWGIGLATVHCPSLRYTHFGGYNHARMGYMFSGGRRYHRKFSSRWVQLEADFVLRVGLLLRIPWYWVQAKIKKDDVSRSALFYALDVNRNWADTLIDRHRYPTEAKTAQAASSGRMAWARRMGREKSPPEDGGPATVLYLHSSDDLYGVDIILLEIVTGLDRKRFTPIVILPEDMRHVGLLSAKLAAHGVESMHLPLAIVRRRYLRPSGVLPLLKALVAGTWAIRRVAKQRNVRIIHGFTLAVLSAPLAAILLRLPLVMHAHEILQRPKVLRKLLHLLGVQWSIRVICVSAATRRNILEDEPAAAGRVQVIHNGIKAAGAPGRSVTELRAMLGVPLDKPLVGMIGRISPWKGQEVFLEAAALVATENPECHFVSIGGVFDKEVHHLDKLNELHRRLGLEKTVTLCGFMPDARDMLSAFDIFISPSTSPDPFPTVILEAMSAGVPVIASAHGGPLEMVVDGVTGLLVPPRDPAALAEAITALLRDPARLRQMAGAGRGRIEENFALTPFVNRIQDLYTEVLVDGD